MAKEWSVEGVVVGSEPFNYQQQQVSVVEVRYQANDKGHFTLEVGQTIEPGSIVRITMRSNAERYGQNNPAYTPYKVTPVIEPLAWCKPTA